MSRGKKALLIIGIVLAVIIIMALFGFLKMRGQSTAVENETFNKDATAKKLAIITDNTIYKMGVKNMLVEAVGGDCCVEVFGLEDAGDVVTTDYDLVLVMAPIYAVGLQNDAKAFIKGADSKDNILLFMTTGLASPPDAGVDTIVSATSDFDNAESPQLSIEEVVSLVLERLG